MIINTPKELVFFNRNSNPENEVDEIIADFQSFYARNTNNNKVYSWGSGDSYILGNKKEKSEKVPYLIDSKFFKNLRVSDLDMGCAHVAVVLTQDESLLNVEYTNIDNKKINKTIIEKSDKPIKRKTDNIPDENEDNTNKNDDNHGILKTFGIRNEFITLNAKDKPKTKTKII